MTTAVRHKRRSRNSLNRENIVQVAMEILQEEGIEGLSMRKIAEKLDCSVASPYSHFKSQEEIIQVLIAKGETELTQLLRNAQRNGKNSFEKLAGIARAYWDFSLNNKELHKVMFNTVHGHMHRKAFPSLPTSYRVFLETIRNGCSSKEFKLPKAEYPAIARMMWAWMYGLMVLDLTNMLKRRRGGKDDPLSEGFLYFRRILLGE
ncbi:TetR/AcrR family transcriptional regulator [Leptospira barantonii]|uniref:TetR/AcrR family transcriptional regulator n=1 Tax=Leptospira barantonii TaxID=2023184 RepID=A0A5F2BUY2_9LEPT|nr:TetR/AcrR family transcriptional regulator [Leptospira barantonii]TGM10201.1 TetR/AcrR family transcriptional regulator [Leptospira barantonii]